MSLSLFNDPLFRDVDRMFDVSPFFSGLSRRTTPGMGLLSEQARSGLWAPSVDVYDTGDSIRVHADLPGVPKENVKADIDKNGNLVIEGETSSEKETENFSSRVRERRYGRFQRVVGLPTNIDPDKVKACFKDGVLDITIPKAEESSRRQISIE